VGEAVAIAGVVVLLLFLAAGMVAGFGWHRIRQHNEVSARQPIRPPLHWAASLGCCGRLHRRLRAAVAAVRLAVPLPARRRGRRHAAPTSVWETLATEIEAQAVALDRELLLADRLRGPTAVAARQAVGRQVRDVERLAHRVASAALAAQQRPGAEPAAETLARITEHLDALDAAREEIARLEAHAR
jgi:hypothetical protein